MRSRTRAHLTTTAACLDASSVWPCWLTSQIMKVSESTSLKKKKFKNPYIGFFYIAVNGHEHQFSAQKGCQGGSLLPLPPYDKNYLNSSRLIAS